MNLRKAVEAILDDQKRNMSWLATELDRTPEGLKLSLNNETIKYSDLKKLVQILNVPIQSLFVGNNLQIQRGGRHNQQHSSLIMGEPEGVFKTLQVETLQKQVRQLESQIIDKDKIIELLSK